MMRNRARGVSAAVRLLLSFVLIIALAAPAIAADGVAGSEAAARMQALGILQGRPADGLALNGTITRAELITIIVRAFGQGEMAKYLQGANAFTDTGSHWASGSIAMAKALLYKTGDSMGYADGTFRPDAKLTSIEALAFLMKFLGVKPDATARAWPANYISGAMAADLITADEAAQLSASFQATATRGMAFYMFDHAFAGYTMPSGKTLYQGTVKPNPPSLAIGAYPDATVRESLVLTGTVGVDAIAVTVGGQPAAVANGQWSQTVSLAMGSNSFSVVATDIVGNSATVQATVQRLAPAHFSTTVIVGSAVDLSGMIPQYGFALSSSVCGGIGSFDAATGQFTAATQTGSGTISLLLDGAPLVDITVNVVLPPPPPPGFDGPGL